MMDLGGAGDPCDNLCNQNTRAIHVTKCEQENTDSKRKYVGE